jgi:hypothetical protein
MARTSYSDRRLEASRAVAAEPAIRDADDHPPGKPWTIDPAGG